MPANLPDSERIFAIPTAAGPNDETATAANSPQQGFSIFSRYLRVKPSRQRKHRYIVGQNYNNNNSNMVVTKMVIRLFDDSTHIFCSISGRQHGDFDKVAVLVTASPDSQRRSQNEDRLCRKTLYIFADYKKAKSSFWFSVSGVHKTAMEAPHKRVMNDPPPSQAILQIFILINFDIDHIFSATS